MNDSKMRKVSADDKEFPLIGRLHNLLKIQQMNKVSTLETVVSVRGNPQSKAEFSFRHYRAIMLKLVIR